MESSLASNPKFAREMDKVRRKYEQYLENLNLDKTLLNNNMKIFVLES